MFEEKQNHESYGMIGISHTSISKSVAMFGSSIKHDRWITIQIKQADVGRCLNQDWYFGKKRLIEVSLSASQFAQFITTPNIGNGVPCTIKSIGNKVMEEPPYIGQNEIFANELQKDFKKAMDSTDTLIHDAKKILLSKGQLKVADRKKLFKKISCLVGHITKNMPFLYEQFTNSMDKTVSIAKAEIESFYNSQITKYGIKALKNKNIPKIEEKTKYNKGV